MAGTTDATDLLARFNLTAFRPGQQDVVDAVADGHDVMCVMPTGGGKSLCYQLPSLARAGVTIVVSPLIALMKDQVDSLDQLGISAKLINSSLSASEQSDVMNQMAAGDLDLVYVAPERLRNGRFLEAVQSANVSLLAIDEAHCVSEWGHDFRPDYARLGMFRQRYLDNVQTIALTATATPAVRDDIIAMLSLNDPSTFVTGFTRPNLRFSVGHAKTDRQKDDRLTRYVKSHKDGAGIIYAATRKRCEEIAEWLPEQVGRPIGVYHAGLDAIQRRQMQDSFMSGKLSAIVATNAFGMGIDKSDIRYVVHYNMPGSLEAYYQEAGRAGRDGKPSECQLLFSYQDRYVQEFFIENRYPSEDTVRRVYEYLLSREEDPIELTLDQVREGSGVKDGSEAVGTAETLLARAGVIRRMDSGSGYAIVRIDSDSPSMLDFLPREAKVRRRVMSAVETIIGKRRGEDVYVKPTRVQDLAKVSKDQFVRTIRELRRLKTFDYVPPFQGRAVHFIDRDRSFADLEIDFGELNKRKAAEYEKLESVIAFANTPTCRQQVILNYFGETESANCGSCDRCNPSGGTTTKNMSVSDLKGVDPDDLLRGIRVTLSGVTRMHGRFGKNLVAQMLCGSKNKKLQQWRLNRLSTYGLLSGLKQNEVVSVMESLVAAGLLIHKEVDERRPTIHITDDGRDLMMNATTVPESIQLPQPLAKKLAKAVSKLESADVQTRSAGTDEADVASDADADKSDNSQTTDTIKRWRRKTAAALGIPAYRIVTDATIGRIAQMMPQDLNELEAISGIGTATLEQFGDDILRLVRQSSSDRESTRPDRQADSETQPDVEKEVGINPTTQAGVEVLTAEESEHKVSNSTDQLSTRSDKTQSAAVDSSSQDLSDAYWTWRLFRDGYSADQICEIRRCDENALIADLTHMLAADHRVNASWIDSEVWRQAITDAQQASQKTSPKGFTGRRLVT